MAISRAVVYIGIGKQYIQEAVKSADSVGGQFPTVLCTNTKGKQSGFDFTFHLPNRAHSEWFVDRVNYFNIIVEQLDFKQILLLDSDTYICGKLIDFFTALEKFDIAGTQAIGRQTLYRDDIPVSFPEIHCGALVFRQNTRVKRLFERWFAIYSEKPEYFGNDQPPFRQALWESKEIRLGVLPFEFCFRYRWGGLVGSEVKVLHGKEHKTPHEQVAKEINDNAGNIRVFTRRELA